jgi:hypothetical protein
MRIHSEFSRNLVPDNTFSAGKTFLTNLTHAAVAAQTGVFHRAVK